MSESTLSITSPSLVSNLWASPSAPTVVGNPQVRAMRAVADRYGSHSGSASDTETFLVLFEDFARQVPEAVGPNVHSAGPLIATEAAGSSYPLAVHAAWAVAALLPNSTVVALNKELGSRGQITGASFLTDEFPGLVKTPVLGKRVTLWRGPAAIAVVLLAAHADTFGIS